MGAASTDPALSHRSPVPARPIGFSANDLPRRFARYVLLRRVAKGGMGEVMLASTMGLEGAERPVIIKTIRSEHRTDASFQARFLDEARVQAQLAHPGVAQVLEATTDDESGEPYVAVEYVEGRSLGDVRARSLSTGKAIAWHEAVAVCATVAEALAHVHERVDATGKPLAIVHRDLSPQNLMLGYGGDVKIIDFGTARGENRRCHTVAGVVFAKPGYVAPEVANGDPGDYRVDQYALGVMLWELCAGRRFLVGEASEHMAAVSKNERNLPPIAAEVGAPLALDGIIGRLTAFARDDRYGETRTSATELATLLGKSPELESGERGVRARVAQLMNRLFEGEAVRVRREFQRLVSQARRSALTPKAPPVPTPRVDVVVTDETRGVLPGTRYRLLGELGRGAKSVVHEAEHLDLGRKVALKIVRVEFATSEDAKARIVREGRVLSTLGLPGIVRLLDVGQTSDGRPFSVLARVEGLSLDRRMAGGATAPWREALALGDQVLAALEPLHEAGVVHRDLKPANVVVADDGRVTLLDFGIALDRREGADAAPPASALGELSVFGTPEYMAPEQVTRPDEVDGRADLYALGTMLFELVAGTLPFPRGAGLSVLEAKREGGPADLPEALDVPAEVRSFFSRALARHASLRFGSAAEMRAAISGLIGAPVVVAAAIAPTSPAPRRKARGLWAAPLALLALAGLGFAASAGHLGEGPASAWGVARDRVVAWTRPAAPPPTALDALVAAAPAEPPPVVAPAEPAPAPAPVPVEPARPYASALEEADAMTPEDPTDVPDDVDAELAAADGAGDTIPAVAQRDPEEASPRDVAPRSTKKASPKKVTKKAPATKAPKKRVADKQSDGQAPRKSKKKKSASSAEKRKKG